MYRLAADWPSTMQIVRLIAQEHMNNKLSIVSLLFYFLKTILWRDLISKFLFMSIFWNWGIQCTRMFFLGKFMHPIVFFQYLILFLFHVLCRQYVGKADFLVFRTLNQHGFLGQLQEKKLVSMFHICVNFFFCCLKRLKIF